MKYQANTDKVNFSESLGQTCNSFKKSIPILLGILLLVGLVQGLIPKEFFSRIFPGNFILDPLVGAILGSVAVGNPITSYVIGGELQAQGVSLIAVTAFILAWVTVGVVQFPAESMMLGRKFALWRNIIGFLTAIVVAILVVTTIRWLG